MQAWSLFFLGLSGSVYVHDLMFECFIWLRQQGLHWGIDLCGDRGLVFSLLKSCSGVLKLTLAKKERYAEFYGGSVVQIDDINPEDLPITAATMRRGTALFSIPDAIKLIDYCQENKIGVLGFDGFRLQGSMLCPDLGCIADFSSSLQDPGFMEASTIACRRILSALNDRELLLEFVLIGGSAL